MLKQKLEKLYDKLNNDYDYYVDYNLLNLDKKQIIDSACEIYHAQNIVYHIEYVFDNYEDGDYIWISEDTIDKILNYKGNFVIYWLEHRYDMRHSERYNLESIEDFSNALSVVVENMGE